MAKKSKVSKRSRTPRTRVIGIQADWYTNPKMSGHHFAIQSHRNAWEQLKPFAKSKAQKDLINAAIKWSNNDWRYWCNLSKKHVSLIKHAIKSIAKKQSWFEIYSWVNQRDGMLVNNLTRFLEVKAYDEDTKFFVAKTSYYGKWLGASAEDAEQRIHERIEKFRVMVEL